MSIANKFKECLICSEQSNMMISFEQCLNECDDLTVAQILANLQFLNISDIERCRQTLCFICAVKLHSAYKFKMKCHRKEMQLQSLHPPTTPIQANIKIENIKREFFDEVSIENDRFEKLENNDQDLVLSVEISTSTPTSVDHSTVSDNEVDIGDLIFKGTAGLNLEKEGNENNSLAIAEKPYVCDVCNKPFSRSNNLLRHKSLHSEMKPYACDVCNKAYKHPNHLAIHKMVHTGERPHVCDVCNKSFTQVGHLISHKMIHTGVKPYVCDVCNKAFNRSSNLMRHKSTHSSSSAT